METNISQHQETCLGEPKIVDLLTGSRLDAQDDDLHISFEELSEEVPDVDGPFRSAEDIHNHSFQSVRDLQYTGLSVCPVHRQIDGSFVSDAVPECDTHSSTPESTQSTGTESENVLDIALPRSVSNDSLSSDSSDEIFTLVRDVPYFEPSRHLRRGRRDRVVPEVSLFESDSSEDERFLRSCFSDMDHVVPGSCVEE
ncbi:hypothetical protein FSP39_010595 [Pinctada imbricata]|uniref:Uncharacterized protein n=1 Tax=Pinctada imbricata TaxID=66713 RepID=A0AA88XW85_PINIB|nr:hypothetical protein FSP39_010595 [Pinctada imbricata]